MSAPFVNSSIHQCECPPGGRSGWLCGDNDTIYCNKCEGIIVRVDNLTLDEMNQIMNEGKALPKKIEVTYIDTSVKCDPHTSGVDCKAIDHSWFNHSQVGLKGGDYPPGYNGEHDR